MPGGDWSDLTTREKAFVIGFGVVQVLLLVAALTDLYRRPAEEIRGWKPVWVFVSLVNILGPISYFAFGRRR